MEGSDRDACRFHLWIFPIVLFFDMDCSSSHEEILNALYPLRSSAIDPLVFHVSLLFDEHLMCASGCSWPVPHTARASSLSAASRVGSSQAGQQPPTTIHRNTPHHNLHITTKPDQLNPHHVNPPSPNNTRFILVQATMASLMRSGMPSSEPGYSFAQAPHTAAGGPRQHGFYP